MHLDTGIISHPENRLLLLRVHFPNYEYQLSDATMTYCAPHHDVTAPKFNHLSDMVILKFGTRASPHPFIAISDR